jgi:hypothetical protein
MLIGDGSRDLDIALVEFGAPRSWGVCESLMWKNMRINENWHVQQHMLIHFAPAGKSN